MSTVTLISSDDLEYVVDVRAARMSRLLSDYLETGLDEDQAIPLPGVDSATLEKVVAYLDAHMNDPVEQEEGERAVDYISPEDREMLGISADNSLRNRNEIYDLIRAANYMEIPSLLKVSTRAVANSLRGKSVDQMRVVLDIPT
jgi:S-phase kinase-associated protein 1